MKRVALGCLGWVPHRWLVGFPWMSVMMGHPDGAKVSTNYVERQNLAMWTGWRLFTRLADAFFSSKVENLAHAVSLHPTPCTTTSLARHKTLTKAAGGYPATPRWLPVSRSTCGAPHRDHGPARLASGHGRTRSW